MPNVNMIALHLQGIQHALIISTKLKITNDFSNYLLKELNGQYRRKTGRQVLRSEQGSTGCYQDKELTQPTLCMTQQRADVIRN